MNAVKTQTTINYNDVKNCWSIIKSTTGSDFFIDQFYQLMFSHHPKTHSLFPQNLTEQKRTLLATLDNVINGIEHIEMLEDALLTLGEHHKNIGVTRDMYEPFIAIIVESANISSNHTLSKNELAAWERAFQNVCNIMLKVY